MIDQKLVDLTNKFLKDFFALSKDDDDLFNFNYLLPEAISKSNFPKYKDNHTILMGMASFDDAIAKVFFNMRIQGFIPIIENKIKYVLDGGKQDDFYLSDIETKDYMKDDMKCEFFKGENGENDFKMVPCKTKASKTTLTVSNSKSGFTGRMIINKELKKRFKDEHNYDEKMTVDSIDFIRDNERVMTIDYKYDFDKYTFYEEGEFTHYKHIASINSFFLTILCV